MFRVTWAMAWFLADLFAKVLYVVRLLFFVCLAGGVVAALVMLYNKHKWNLGGGPVTQDAKAVVSSGSMEPAVPQGSLIQVCPWSEYMVGDVVVYERRDKLICHRIMDIRGDQVLTKGDANPTPDEPILMNQIKGRVLMDKISRPKLHGKMKFVFQKTYAALQTRTESSQKAITAATKVELQCDGDKEIAVGEDDDCFAFSVNGKTDVPVKYDLTFTLKSDDTFTEEEWDSLEPYLFMDGDMIPLSLVDSTPGDFIEKEKVYMTDFKVRIPANRDYNSRFDFGIEADRIEGPKEILASVTMHAEQVDMLVSSQDVGMSLIPPVYAMYMSTQSIDDIVFSIY